MQFSKGTHKIVRGILFAMVIIIVMAFFLSCIKVKSTVYRVTAPIIVIKYVDGSKYIVMLEGRRAESIYQSNLRITIRPNSKPTLAYSVDKNGKALFSADYEFIFQDYEQVKEYLHMEPGKNAQVYATAEATASGCFISTSMETRRDDISLYIASYF